MLRADNIMMAHAYGAGIPGTFHHEDNQPYPAPRHMPHAGPHQPFDLATRPHMQHNGPPGATDVKPRLTKEQHDILESHFQQQPKPSTNTKRGFAENLGVPVDKINVRTSPHFSLVLTLTSPRIGSRTDGRR